MRDLTVWVGGGGKKGHGVRVMASLMEWVTGCVGYGGERWDGEHRSATECHFCESRNSGISIARWKILSVSKKGVTRIRNPSNIVEILSYDMSGEHKHKNFGHSSCKIKYFSVNLENSLSQSRLGTW